MTKWQLVSNKYISWVLKVSNRKYYCVVKHFAFLKNICYQYLNFVLAVTDCFFTNCWLAHSQLSWNVLLFSCNPNVQLGQDGPITDSSHTVTGQIKVAMIIIWPHGGYVGGSGVGGGGDNGSNVVYKMALGHCLTISSSNHDLWSIFWGT